MKKLILLSILFWGCDNSTAPTPTHGCLDSQACNYDSGATIDNNSCIYETNCAGVCGGADTIYTYYIDEDGDGLGYGYGTEYCSDSFPDDWVMNDDDVEPNCSNNDTDECNVCGGDNSTCNRCRIVTTQTETITNANSCYDSNTSLDNTTETNCYDNISQEECSNYFSEQNCYNYNDGNTHCDINRCSSTAIYYEQGSCENYDGN